MPCMSYEDSDYQQHSEVQDKLDMLTRIACKAMRELEANGIAEGIMLRDDEVRQWYENHKKLDSKYKDD